MGKVVDKVFGDNKGPSQEEQNAQVAIQNKADRDYENAMFEKRDAAAVEREEQAHKDEMERLRLKEKGLRQRESEETLQGLGLAGLSDITLGNDDAVAETAVAEDYDAANFGKLNDTLNAGTGLII
jgi:hypothetical protein